MCEILVKPPQTKLQSVPITPTPPVIEHQEAIKEQLTPIPTEPEELYSPVEDHDLTPIPKKTPSIETVVFEEQIKEDIPLITENFLLI